MLAFYILLTISPSLQASQKKHYRVGIPTNKAPFAFLAWTKKGMALRGAYIDVMAQIAHHMGAEFEYIKSNNHSMLIDLLYKDKIDIMGLTLDLDIGKLLTDYNTIPVGLSIKSWLFVHKSCKTIVCQKDLIGKKVAIIGTNELGLWPVDTPNNSEFFPVLHPMEGLSLLNDGDVDAFIAPSERIAGYIIQEEKLENVRRVGLALRTVRLALSLDKADTLLSGKLLKAIEKTKASGIIHQIEDKWYGVDFRQSFFEKYTRLLFSIVAFILLVLGFVITWNRQLKKQVGKITNRLKTSENRYRNLIESSPDMMFVVSRDGRIYNMNREARFLMPSGCDTRDFCPNLKELLSPADKGDLEEFLETVFTIKRSSKEFRFTDRQIGYREIDIAATLLPSEPGEKQRACLFARDVTQRNRIERDLVQADRMALIGQMATDVAHEINNPIGIVRTNIDVILARKWFAPEAKEFLESCKRNTVRAGDFTRDLLAMAKPKVPEMKELNFWELTNNTIGIMGAQLKRINIKKQTKGEPAIILGDRNLLQQVLINLLLNATAAMKNNTAPEISITCCVPKGVDMVRLRIEDKGVGIPKHNLNEVFEPFFTHGKKEGFGLGLFISKRIIDNHNGVIYAESEINIGTQFVIEIPLLTIDQSNTQS